MIRTENGKVEVYLDNWLSGLLVETTKVLVEVRKLTEEVLDEKKAEKVIKDVVKLSGRLKAEGWTESTGLSDREIISLLKMDK